MPTTLLAVDDSVTMRRVLEMTFAGEDFRVITADGADAALARIRAERPAVVLADVTLDGTNGYGLCSKIKADFPAVGVILLASKQSPYDSQKGAAARADDFIEKPFDTQQLIDKVKRVLSRPAEASRAPAPIAAAPAEASSTRSTAPFGAARPAPAPVPVTVRPQVAPAAAPPAPPVMDQRPAGRGTLAYSSPPGTRAAVPAPTSTPSSGAGSRAPAPAPVPAAPPVAAAPVAAAVAGVVNGALGSQLSQMGLTEAQVHGVLALSREIVERVVWEVVPVLAETIIKEEIQRLTRE